MAKIIEEETIELKYAQKQDRTYGFTITIKGENMGTLLPEDQIKIRRVLNGYLQYRGLRIVNVPFTCLYCSHEDSWICKSCTLNPKLEKKAKKYAQNHWEEKR